MATLTDNDHGILQPVCQNCSTSTTPLWRRDEIGSVLCNACGLFLKLHGRNRPLALKTDVIKSRNRVKSSGQGQKKKVRSWRTWKRLQADWSRVALIRWQWQSHYSVRSWNSTAEPRQPSPSISQDIFRRFRSFQLPSLSDRHTSHAASPQHRPSAHVRPCLSNRPHLQPITLSSCHAPSTPLPRLHFLSHRPSSRTPAHL